MRNVLTAVAIAMVSSQAAAVTSFGNYDCGQWFARSAVARVWLLGYLSGLAAGDSTAKFDVLERLNSADQAYLWMDNYCKANPLKKVSDGGITLYLELERGK